VGDKAEVQGQRKKYAKDSNEAKLKASEKKSLILLEMTLMWNTLKTNGIKVLAISLGISASVNLFLAAIIMVMIFQPADVRVVTTNTAGQVVEIPTVDQAMYDDISAKKYALDAVAHLFTLHQDNFKRELEEHSGRYLVPGGRETFYNGLAAMNLLPFLNNVTKHPGATVNINTSIGPTITLTSEMDQAMGRHAWSFRVPAAITITDAINGSSTSKHIFTVKLVRLLMKEKADGIGVMKIVETQRM